ncbi:MAG: rod shape-determining protein RodA [Candidatus Omnitrophota bacterium]
MYKKDASIFKVEPWLVLIVGMVFIFGLFILASASHQQWVSHGKNYLTRQAFWMGISFIVLYLVTKINHTAILSWAHVLYVLNMILLALLLIIGHISMGAQRWFSIAGFTLQPSEFSKIVLILTIARLISDNPRWQNDAKFFIRCLLVTIFPMVLIALQPDLGTALIFLPVLFAMLYVGGIRLKYILVSGVLLLLSAPVMWHFLQPYQKNRLLVFINPNLDPLGAGYTIIQSRIAIGSGRFFGKGWFAGTQNQLNFLPERHTDFIFSVVGEEWGFVGACFLLGLYLLFILRALTIAANTKTMSQLVIVIGIVAMFIGHIIINISMTMGLMPVVGLPLPFMSYGGSYLLSAMIAVGLLINIQSNRF